MRGKTKRNGVLIESKPKSTVQQTTHLLKDKPDASGKVTASTAVTKDEEQAVSENAVKPFDPKPSNTAEESKVQNGPRESSVESLRIPSKEHLLPAKRLMRSQREGEVKRPYLNEATFDESIAEAEVEESEPVKPSKSNEEKIADFAALV